MSLLDSIARFRVARKERRGDIRGLVRLMRSRSVAARIEADRALDQLDPRFLDELVDAFRREDNEFARADVARALGRLGDPRAVEPLIEVLERTDSWTRDAAASALGQLGDARAVLPLLEALTERRVGGNAAVALGEIGDPRAVEPLIEVLVDDERDTDAYEVWPSRVRSLRIAAAQALGALRDPRGVPPLIEALSDWRVRSDAARALGEIGDRGALEPLVSTLTGHRGSGEYIGVALKRIDEARSIRLLISPLEDDDAEVRRRATEALGELKDPRAVQLLVTELEDSDHQVRQAAFRALARMDWQPASGHDRVVAAIANREWERAAAAGPDALDPLRAALGDAEPFVRLQAARALGVLGDAGAVEPLIAAIEKALPRATGRGVWEGAVAAEARALGKIGDVRAVNILVRLAGTDNGPPARDALEAILDQSGPEIARDELARLAELPDGIEAYLYANPNMDPEWGANLETAYQPVSFSGVRERAQMELDRRGE